MSALPKSREGLFHRWYCNARVLLLLLGGGVRIFWFVVCNPRLSAIARRRVAATTQRAHRAVDLMPLRPVAEGVYSFRDRDSATSPCEEPVPLVLHFTGTGESVHAAFDAVFPLCQRVPSLQHAVHYVFQAPFARGAYYGPHVFGGAMWERVARVVEHYDGPFVLVGLSRGALVALETGMRIVTELGKVASVLSLSAPLDVPTRIPGVVHTVASFESMLQQLVELSPRVPRALMRFAEYSVHRIYELLTALVMTDLEIDGSSQLALQLAELEEHDVMAAALRASREFRMLLQASRRDGQLFCRQLATATAQNEGRLYAALIWGACDTWMEPGRCESVMRDALRRESSHEWLATALVSGQGHALGRTSLDKAPVIYWLQAVAQRAEQGARASHARADHTKKVQARLAGRTEESSE